MASSEVQPNQKTQGGVTLPIASWQLPGCSESFFILILLQEMDPASSSKLSESDIVTNIQQESDRLQILQIEMGDGRKHHVVKLLGSVPQGFGR